MNRLLYANMFSHLKEMEMEEKEEENNFGLLLYAACREKVQERIRKMRNREFMDKKF